MKREAQDGKSESALPFVGTWYSCSADALAKGLQTSFSRGLSDHHAQERFQRDGPNELPEAPPPSLLGLFLSQFTSVIVWVLIGAAILSGFWRTGWMRRPSWPLCYSMASLGLSRSSGRSGP